jgi:hypothetical protein
MDSEELATPAEITPLARLSRDLKAAAGTLAAEEAAYLVDLYFEMQEQRIRAATQLRMASEHAESNALLSWVHENYASLEGDPKRAMDAYTDAHELGVWLKSLIGIGPVLAAGIMAHLAALRGQSVSSLWSFAGLNPEQRWERGQKRPWNARLKLICWKCGQSFVKTSGHPRSFYGPLYAAQKGKLQAQNEAGQFADAAAAALREKRIGQDTEAYKAYVQSKLPPAHLQARAERWTVKLFLSHAFAVNYELTHSGQPAPRP